MYVKSEKNVFFKKISSREPLDITWRNIRGNFGKIEIGRLKHHTSPPPPADLWHYLR